MYPICLSSKLENLIFVWELFSWVWPTILKVQNSNFCPDKNLQSIFMFSVIYFLWKLEKTITKFGLAPKSTWLKVNTFKYTFFKLKKISKPDNSLKDNWVQTQNGNGRWQTVIHFWVAPCSNLKKMFVIIYFIFCLWEG